jgi:hypothetical protein
VGFGIDRRARSRKGKGLFRKAPDPQEVGDRLGRLVKRAEKGRLLKNGWKQDKHIIEVSFHDAAPPARLVVGPDAELSVRAETSTLGPGYHAHVLGRLAPILDELEYVWTEPEAVDPAAGVCAWLAGELSRDGVINLVDRDFVTDASVLTRLGPRDASWRSDVIFEPGRGADAFPWWSTDKGMGARASALVAMWLEVPWREPIDDAERATMEQVDADLTAAQKAGLTDLPFAEWAEMLGYLDRDDAEHRKKVREAVGSRTPTIGYRRLDVEVELSGGWVVRLPGSFVGAWEDDNARYWATDGERTIEFTSLTATDEQSSERLLAVAPEQHRVVERFADDSRHGRAEVSDEDDVHIIHGLVAAAPHVAIVTCKGRVRDEPWALATWRSVRRG